MLASDHEPFRSLRIRRSPDKSKTFELIELRHVPGHPMEAEVIAKKSLFDCALTAVAWVRGAYRGIPGVNFDETDCDE